MPSALQNFAAPRFLGEFRHKVEGRNRITIPAEWRFSKKVELFMIPKSLKTCISVMLKPELDRLLAKADTMEPADRSNFFDMMGRSLKPVAMDQGGRISIPEGYFKHLLLPEAEEVWLTGSMNTFNIWSVPAFEAFHAQNASHEEELKRKLGI